MEDGGLPNDAIAVIRGVKHHLKNWVTYGQVFLSSGKVFQLSFDDIFFCLNVARSIHQLQFFRVESFLSNRYV